MIQTRKRGKFSSPDATEELVVSSKTIPVIEEAV
jgi:hypothetical protein